MRLHFHGPSRPLLLSLALLTAAVGATGATDPPRRDAEDQTLRNQYPGTAIPGLSPAESDRFDAGAALFSKLWTPADGLGPQMNSNSCASCHHNPLPGGDEFAPARFVAHARACVDVIGSHSCPRLQLGPGGTTVKRELPKDATLRKPQSLYGLGMLEAVSDDDILALARTQQDDPDGVRGQPGRTAEGRIGRFGWKARFADIDGFVAAAFRVEMGLTSRHYPGTGEGDRPREIEDPVIRSTGDFVRMLAAPPLTPRGDTSAGRALFDSLRCSACHVQALRSSTSAVPVLSNRRFLAYTDLLVHDMGPGLADDIVEGPASGSSFRTPPLWGLNASGPPYLHDGRAGSVIEAILMHGGEAAPARARFAHLTPQELDSLLLFLSSI
jgi:CxxC motif-containing protein (DUF1111 family)